MEKYSQRLDINNNVEVLTQSQLEALSRLMPPFFFITVTSLVDWKIIKVIGVRECLGYLEQDFTLEHYFNCIPQPYSDMVIEYGITTYDILAKTSNLKPDDLLETSYNISFPMFTYGRDLLFFKRMSKIFATDENGKIVANVNVHFVDNTSHPITRPFLMTKKDQNDAVAKKIEQQIVGVATPKIKAIIENHFSKTHGKKLFLSKQCERVAILKAAGLSARKIAEKLEIGQDRVNDLSRTLLNNVQETFNLNFKYGTDAALFLTELNLIPKSD